MTEESETLPNTNFVAVVSLSLPEMEHAVTARVVLTPSDKIPVDGRFKPLPDCTLEDLQQFANELEADMWQTYQQIKLTELVEDEGVAVKLDVIGKDGEPIAPSKEWDWTKQVVMLAEMEEETAVADEDEASEIEPPPVAVAEEPADEPETAVVEEPAPIQAKVGIDEPKQTEAPEPTPTLQSDEALINIIVATTEPIHEEREAEEAPEPEDESAVIAPSKARVRVAGKRLPIGTTDPSAVDILMEEPALRAAQAHALSSMSREVAGVLVGPRPEKQPDGRYVVQIIDTIVAKHTVMQGASVTYTPESWRYMTDKLWEKYPDDTAVIVGWYHTHPGFGIFLSGMDLFIHQNFFTQIWHIAYVLDPRARTSGFFSWDRQKTHVSRYNFQWPYWASSSW